MENNQSIHERAFLALSTKWFSSFKKIEKFETPERETDLVALASLLIAAEFPDRLSINAFIVASENSILASKRPAPWVDRLPWAIARDYIADELGIEEGWEDGLFVVANSLNESNSALRNWAMEVAWFVRLRIPREEAIQNLLENVATTLAYTTDAWGLASGMFPDKESFYQAVDAYQPDDFCQQYAERVAFFKKVYPTNWQAPFWRLEAQVREKIQRVIEKNGEFSFHKIFPEEKRESLIDAAKALADAGINEPVEFAALLDERFNGRFKSYTQSLWNLIIPFDQTGVACKTPAPDWESIYQKHSHPIGCS